jgi:hypothetical protein
MGAPDDFFSYYSRNPVGVIDQNTWLDRDAEVNLAFNTQPVVYTPLVSWINRSQLTGAPLSEFTDLLEGDVNNDEISMSAQYIPEPYGVDSRARRISTARYGDKVQFVETSNIFQQWKLGVGGGRDWRPVLRGLLGQNVVKKMEILSRNAYLKGPAEFHTFAGGKTSIAALGSGDTFGIETANAWNLRLGYTGSPVIPGDTAAAKVCIVPPGAIYDFQESLHTTNATDAAMWKASIEYSGMKLRYEIGEYKNIRFVQAPTDRYGINPAVLYNTGTIVVQAKVTSPITSGDGSPDPEAEKVDGVWYVGQKAVTHYIQLDTGDDGATPPVANVDMSQFALNDQISVHLVRTNVWGVTNGVDPTSGKTVVRRIVKIDAVNKRLSFDRPIMSNYIVDIDAGAGTTYAYVTKGRHIGMNLVMGSIGGIMGNVNRPLRFYEPKPIDDFDSVWRFSWDFIGGFNIWEPNLFEIHFSSVSTPKPGGINVA